MSVNSGISIIIPTCDRLHQVETCIRRVLESVDACGLGEYEIIISDDSYGRNASGLVSEFGDRVLWVQGPRRGPAANRNRAIVNTKYEWSIFIDDDCIPDLAWVGDFCTSINIGTYDFIEGTTMPDGRQPRLKDEAPHIERGSMLGAGNLAVRKSSFLELGGFDEDYRFLLEDVDLQTKIEKSKYCWGFSKARALHPWRTRRAFRRKVADLKAWDVFFRKHPDQISKYRIGFVASPVLKFWRDVNTEVIEYKFSDVRYCLNDFVVNYIIVYKIIFYKMKYNIENIFK